MEDHRAPPSPSCSREHAAIAMRLARMDSDDDDDPGKYLPGYFARGDKLLRGLHNRVEKLAKVNKWQHRVYLDTRLCNTCAKNVRGLNSQQVVKLECLCLGIEWLCKARQYIISTHTLTIPDKKIMSQGEYFRGAKSILQGNTVPKGWKFLTQWHNSLVKIQPHLKPVCDNMEVSTFFEGYLIQFEGGNNSLRLPQQGEEIVPHMGEGSLLHRENVFWKSDPAYTGKFTADPEEIDIGMEECCEQDQGQDEPDGRDSPEPEKSSRVKVDNFLGVSVDLGESGRGLKLFFRANDNPCSFCMRLSRKTHEWVNCSGSERVCFAKYKLVKEPLPFLNSSGELVKALNQCVELKSYQQWLNNIFTCYDKNRSIDCMVSFNNQLLQCSPHMKKYIVIYEAVIHKGWGCLTHMKNNLF